MGRFGDCLYGYCEARWLSFIHEYDFYYYPFIHSDELVMSTKLKHRTDFTFKKEIMIRDAKTIDKNESGTLYIGDGFLANNPVNFANKEFMKLLKSEISPIKPIEPITFPANHLTVALHVRRGGGYDHQLFQSDTISNTRTKFADQIDPTRFPPDTFYIDHLRYVIELYPDTNIYVHIFTDDPNPASIVRKFQQAVNNPKLVFGYREEGNRHDKNVLSDFFNMMNFDCLIRAGSNYSAMAGIIGQVKLEIKPTSYVWNGNILIIDKAKVIDRTKEKPRITYVKRNSQES
jgi:hypothetical protein